MEGQKGISGRKELSDLPQSKNGRAILESFLHPSAYAE
jgi:hypothetical protein